MNAPALGVLRRVVEHVDDPALAQQLSVATLLATSVPTIVDVQVPATAVRSRLPPGPLPVSAQVGPDDDCEAEVLVFVQDGLLVSVELLWYGDDEPRWPDPDQVLLAPDDRQEPRLVPLSDLPAALDEAEAAGRLVLGLEGFRRVEGGVQPDLAFVADLGGHDLTVPAAAAEARSIARAWQADGGPDLVEIVD